MVGKRPATSELNHDNWDQEDEAEEIGTFRMASENEIKNRVMKRAKRHLTTDNASASASNGQPAAKGIFSNFTGFGLPSTSTSEAKVSPFGFLLKTSTDSSASNLPKGDALSKIFNTASNANSAKNFSFSATPATSTPVNEATSLPTSSVKEKPNNSDNSKLIYYAKLKGLNRSVSTWIKQHVDENPLCILTPIFNDYNNYLKEIEAENEKPSCSFSALLKTSRNDTNTTEKNPALATMTATPTKPSNEPSAPASKSETTTGDTISYKSPKFFNFDMKTNETAGSSNNSNINSDLNASVTPTSSKASTFSFVKPDASPAAKPFSFGSSSIPFTFSNVKPTSSETATDQAADETEDEPPKVEFTKVVETDAVYSKTCKVFVKKDENYVDKGVGCLYLKKVDSSEKIQLIVRADTSLGNILLNFILNNDIPTKRMGKNNVMLMCFPTPDVKKLTTILLRVKNADDADELLQTIDKYKNLKNNL